MQIALVATACYSNAIRITASKDTEEIADEMQAFADGMSEHLLYTGENSDRDGSDYVDLRNEDDAVIQAQVMEYIDEILAREDLDETDMEKMGMQNMLDQLMGDTADLDGAKQLMAEAVTDYFRNNGDYYIGKNAEGIRVALQDQIAC